MAYKFSIQKSLAKCFSRTREPHCAAYKTKYTRLVIKKIFKKVVIHPLTPKIWSLILSSIYNTAFFMNR